MFYVILTKQNDILLENLYIEIIFCTNFLHKSPHNKFKKKFHQDENIWVKKPKPWDVGSYFYLKYYFDNPEK